MKDFKWKEGYREWKDGKPSSYELTTDHIKISVHRHIDYPDDAWLVSCHDVGIIQKQLKSKIVVTARNESVVLVKRKLQLMIDSVNF
jgi:hypothetical protein